MNIAFQSLVYWPHVGGIETVARLLAEEIASLGHAVTVLTETPAASEEPSKVSVLRSPSWSRQTKVLRESDVVLMFGTSLKFLPLAIAARCPTVVSHHGWYDGWRPAAVLKRQINRFTRNVAPSRAVALALGAPAEVIQNPYDDSVFRRLRQVTRSRDFAFVGRLVSDKGLALLVEAVSELARQGLRPSLTIVGTGPEESRCREAARVAGVDAQIEWAGEQKGEALAQLLNGHRVLVVPSVWNEPFGVVALEGLACGCAVVGSAGGGLPEAMGPVGRTFPNGDARALAGAMRAALSEPLSTPDEVEKHLRGHTRQAAARRYLAVLQGAARQ
jgi:glycogen(starch) synthase